MKVSKFIFLAMIIVIIACNRDYTSHYNEIEAQVIHNVLESLINIEYYHGPPYPLEVHAPDSFPESQVWAKLDEHAGALRSYYDRIDTTTLVLFISDTLHTIENEYIPKKRFDTAYYFYEPHHNISQQNRQVIFNDSSSTGRYVIVNPDFDMSLDMYERFGFRNDTLYVGVIAFSRVLFNEDITEGVFTFSIAYSPTASKSEIVIVARKEERWEIQGTYLYEIS